MKGSSMMVRLWGMLGTFEEWNSASLGHSNHTIHILNAPVALEDLFKLINVVPLWFQKENQRMVITGYRNSRIAV